MILLIDHYDSFSDMLADYFRQLGQEIKIIRTDQDALKIIKNKKPSHIVLSPGPGHPAQVESFCNVIKAYQQTTPILGVCLGHQAIAEVWGGKVVPAGRIMHGVVSAVEHQQQGLFENIPNPLNVTRYHSLIIDPETLPAELKITAVTLTPQGAPEIMAIQHEFYPLFGIQFHPEAVLTEYGLKLLENFIKL